MVFADTYTFGPVPPATNFPWRLYSNVFHQGLLILGGFGPSRRLISHMEICTERMLDCREAMVTSLSIDPLEISSPEQMEAMWKGPEIMSARIDIDSGAVTPEAWYGAKPFSPEWVEYLKVAFDPKLLGALQREWLEATGGVPGGVRDSLGTSRIGRNAFCPCGSGKKYKRCCA